MKKHLLIKVVVGLLLYGLVLTDLCSYAGDVDPWMYNRGIKPMPTEGISSSLTNDASFAESLLAGALHIFISTISEVDGERCPMYPTCSSYALQAVRKHGPVIGFFMTADRLIHESDEMNQAPLIRSGETTRFFDPVEANDFWWNSRK